MKICISLKPLSIPIGFQANEYILKLYIILLMEKREEETIIKML